MNNDRILRIMAYEVRAGDVLQTRLTEIAPLGDHTVYETSFSTELGLICLNVEGRLHYFERGEQVKLNFTKTVRRS